MLSEMIEHTMFAVSADETRVNLNGIYVERPEAGKLRMVATDGHRLAMITRAVERAELPEAGVIIPRKGGDGAAQGAGERRRAGRAHACRAASRTPRAARVRAVDAPGRGRVSRLQPGHPAEVGAPCVGRRRASLLAALRRVSIVSSERTRGVKLQLDSRTPGAHDDQSGRRRGRARRSSVEYDGEPFGIGFNARYLMDVLGVLPADKRSRDRPQRRGQPRRAAREGDADYLLCRDADAALIRARSTSAFGGRVRRRLERRS